MQYSLYIHGYFLPLLEKMRGQGLIKKGTSVINHETPSGATFILKYEGEVDAEGRACGVGKLIDN